MVMSARESFFVQYLLNTREVGAIAPSSKSLAKRMIDKAKVSDAKFLAEFGAGMGNVTRKILEAMHPQAQLLVFEPHTHFYNKLQSIQDPRIHHLQAPAQNLPKYLRKNGFPKLDCIISGIPLANLSAETQQDIIKTAYMGLQTLGRFVQFQYSLLSRKHIKSIFGNVSISYVLWNLPPAAVYTSIKKP